MLLSFNLLSMGMHVASTHVNSCFRQAAKVSMILYEEVREHFLESLYTVHSDVPSSPEARLAGLVAQTSEYPRLFVDHIRVLAL